jgi:hypothetical protein
MMTAEHFLPKPFALPEYERAQFEFFGLAIKGMMKAKSSIFAQIPEAEPTENLPVTQNTMLSGEVVATPPLELATKVEIKLDDIRLRNLESLGELIDSLAEERLTHFMAHLCDMLGRTSEGAGTATDMAGAPLTFESYLESFSKMELRFQRDGTPMMPQMFGSPGAMKAFSALWNFNEAQQTQWDEMIDGKRKEFFANRRHRKLC